MYTHTFMRSKLLLDSKEEATLKIPLIWKKARTKVGRVSIISRSKFGDKQKKQGKTDVRKSRIFFFK